MSAQCPKAVRRPTDRRVEVCCATKTLSSPANKLRMFGALSSLDLEVARTFGKQGDCRGQAAEPCYPSDLVAPGSFVLALTENHTI